MDVRRGEEGNKHEVAGETPDRQQKRSEGAVNDARPARRPRRHQPGGLTRAKLLRPAGNRRIQSP